MDYIERKGRAILKKAGITIGGKNPQDIQIHNNKFFHRLLAHGTIALGESYVDGWWDSRAVDQTIYHILQADLIDFRTGAFKGLGIPFANKLHLIGSLLFNHQSRKQASVDANFHYSMDNELFKATLDKKLAYSCGYWKKAKTLDQSQIDKFDLICRKLKLKKGMHILDVGCGYGGFAKYASDKYGVRVTGFTNSKAQYEYAKKYCKGSKVKILLQDYRDIKGKYDHAVCIEMMEHGGYKNHKKFIKIIHDALKPDGLFLIQAISISISQIRNEPWIEKYVFPGSIAISAKQFCDATEGKFYVADWHDFTQDYHKTMICWYKNFHKNWPKLKHKYDRRFYRYFKYYLLCAPGTALAKTHHLWQIVFAKVDSDKQYVRVPQ